MSGIEQLMARNNRISSTFLHHLTRSWTVVMVNKHSYAPHRHRGVGGIERCRSLSICLSALCP